MSTRNTQSQVALCFKPYSLTLTKAANGHESANEDDERDDELVVSDYGPERENADDDRVIGGEVAAACERGVNDAREK